MVTHSQQFLRHRQMLTVAPVVLIPFIVLLFWSLDGGKASGKANDAKLVETRGINTSLPKANLTANEPTDKMSLYALATKDSLEKRKNAPLVSDTNSLQRIGQTTASQYGQTAVVNNHGLNPNPVQPRGYKDPNEEKVNRKLNELYQQMGQNGNVSPAATNSNTSSQSSARDDETNTQLAQINQSMKDLSADKGADDPEMQQLNGMLDKILDVQNPQRVKDRLREKSLLNRQAVYPVSASTGEGRVSIIRQTAYGRKIQQDTQKVPAGMPAGYKPKYQSRMVYPVTAPQTMKNGFYGLGDSGNSANAEPNAVNAVIHQSQTLVTGATVKLRLLSDIYVNGVRIPKNNFIYGVASVNGERLNISINSVRYQNSLFPVSLAAFDMDGLSGIYIPGAIERDASKDAAAQGLQGVDYTTLDPSVTAQAASAAVSGAKGLLSKKIRLVKVNVKANYRVLLQDGNQVK